MSSTISIEEIVDILYGNLVDNIDHNQCVVYLTNGCKITFVEIYTEWQRFKNALEGEY